MSGLTGLTPHQQAALAYIAANPQSSVQEICAAVGIAEHARYNNRAAFIERLIATGQVALVPTDPDLR